MRFFESSLSSDWSEAFPTSTLWALAVWALGIALFSVALLPENLQAQVPQNVIAECNACDAQDVHAVDVDGDGDKDILSASEYDNKIAWYENTDGNGSFSGQQVITTSAAGAQSVYAADLDNDGDIDVLSASTALYDDKIAWYENTDGNGSFSGQQVITTNVDGGNYVYAADLDNDGDKDVLSASYNKIAWYENLDSGGVSATQNVITTNAGQVRSVYAADVDGDGDKDILSASSSDNKIAWYENLDSGGVSTTQNVITTNARGAQSVYAADVDGDGDIDVLSASRGDNKIAWHENTDGDGSFSGQQVITTSATGAQSVYAADLDNDGDMDILSASSDYSTDGEIAWYENTDGNGSFSDQQVITTNAREARSVYAADLDNDGDKDVLSASSRDDKIAWHENLDSGGVSTTQQVITTNADGAESVYAADLDGDSDIDVLSASLGDNKIAWYENTDGDGNFSGQQVITTNADFARSVYAADLDNDGDKDVLSASEGGVDNDSKIAWYENTDGDGSFSGQQVITTNADVAQSVHAADLDGDSDPDILSASSGDSKIAWYENTNSVLPVELASFQARTSESGVRLNWQTASETNNAGFYVQHRAAPRENSQSDWARLSFVEGVGTTSESQSYRFEIEDLGPGTHEFRLRQVDTDGTAHHSKVVSTDIQMRKKVRLTAPAPNPITTTARLTFAVKEVEKATVILYNTLGQQVATLYEGRPTPGEQVSLQLDTSTLGSGAYIVRLKVGGTLKTRKITVVK